MKVLATNRRASYDYEILQRFEAGIVLNGLEVKSIKAGHIDLKGGYINFKGQEAFLVNSHIPLYFQSSEIKNYNPNRQRKLLLHKKEILEMINTAKSQHLTAIPLKAGLVRGKIKIEIALVRAKRKYDKREVKKRKTMLKDAQLESRF